MTKKFARGTHAVAICQRCGRKLPYLDLKFDGYMPDLRVCPECWDPPDPTDDGWKGSANVIARRALPPPPDPEPEGPPPLTCPPVNAPAGPYPTNTCIVLTPDDIVDGQIYKILVGLDTNIYVSASEDLVLTSGPEFSFPPGGLNLDGAGDNGWVWLDTSRLTITGNVFGAAIWLGAFGAGSNFQLKIENSRYGNTGAIDGSAGFAVEFTGPLSGTVQVLNGRSGITGTIEDEIP